MEFGRSVGTRIRQIRDERRMSRTALVNALGSKPDGKPWISTSYLKQIENGPAILTNTDLIARIARALGTGPETLLGYPDLLRHDAFENGGIPLLRRLLQPPAGLRLRFFDRDPRDPAAIMGDVEHAWARWQASEYGRLGDQLPALLSEAQEAAETTTAPAGWTTLSEAYNVTSELLSKLGHLDLAYIAVDSAARAAARAADPLSEAMASWHLCEVLFRQGRADEAFRVAEAALTSLEASGLPHDHPYLAVTGALHLRAVIGAARMGAGRDAWHHHTEATSIAAHLPAGGNYRWTVFNASNAAMHGVSAAVDLSEYEEALRRQGAVDYACVPSVERVARHRVEHARALQALENWDGLTGVLQGAAVLAPEEFRYQRFAREAIRSAWQSVDDRRQVPHLTELAHLTGIAYEP